MTRTVLLFIFLCLILNFSLFAQKGDSACLYHIKFYNWECDYWHYLNQFDTVPKYDVGTGEVVGEIIVENEGWGNKDMSLLKMDSTFLDTITNHPAMVEVTSCDRLMKYEVFGYEFRSVEASSSVHVNFTNAYDGLYALKCLRSYIIKYGLSLYSVTVKLSAKYKGEPIKDIFPLDLILWPNEK